MSDLLEFRLLKYVAMIAETGNFTRAAERLYLAQPSLSEQIKNLEEGLGIEIFERGRNRVEPEQRKKDQSAVQLELLN